MRRGRRDEFFALPRGREAAVRAAPAGGQPGLRRPRGARPWPTASVSSAPPDLFEAFNIGPDDVDETDPAIAAERAPVVRRRTSGPTAPASLRPALVAYLDAVRARGRRRCSTCSPLALDLPDGLVPAVHRRTRPTTLRIDPLRDAARATPTRSTGQLRMGAHTDYGIVTVLYADQVPGLQIVGPDGEWHDVVPGARRVPRQPRRPHGRSGRTTAGARRCTACCRRPACPTARTAARSVAFFHDGNHDAVIECLPTCRSAEHPPKYAPVTAGEHLMAKLLGPRTGTTSVAADTAGDRLSAARRR